MTEMINNLLGETVNNLSADMYCLLVMFLFTYIITIVTAITGYMKFK